MTKEEAAEELGLSVPSVQRYARLCGIKPVPVEGARRKRSYSAFVFTGEDIDRMRAFHRGKLESTAKKRAARMREPARVEANRKVLARQNRLSQHRALLREEKDHFRQVVAYHIGPVVTEDPELTSTVPGGPQFAMIQWSGFYPPETLDHDSGTHIWEPKRARRATVSLEGLPPIVRARLGI
jgi:hypothetical protein